MIEKLKEGLRFEFLTSLTVKITALWEHEAVWPHRSVPTFQRIRLLPLSCALIKKMQKIPPERLYIPFRLDGDAAQNASNVIGS
jgi:hypothetical protein